MDTTENGQGTSRDSVNAHARGIVENESVAASLSAIEKPNSWNPFLEESISLNENEFVTDTINESSSSNPFLSPTDTFLENVNEARQEVAGCIPKTKSYKKHSGNDKAVAGSVDRRESNQFLSTNPFALSTKTQLQPPSGSGEYITKTSTGNPNDKICPVSQLVDLTSEEEKFINDKICPVSQLVDLTSEEEKFIALAFFEACEKQRLIYQKSEGWRYYLKDFGLQRDLHEAQNHIIKSCFETCPWKKKQIIFLRVTFVYNLSMFWITVKSKMFDLFTKRLNNCYSKFKDILKTKEYFSYKYFVVKLNNNYYRATILGYLPEDPFKLEVFLFDFGLVTCVPTNEVHYLLPRFLSMPQFAIKGSLANICPKNCTAWTYNDVTMFKFYLSDKMLLGQIVEIDYKNEVLQLAIGEVPKDGCEITFYNKIVIDEGIAQYKV